MRVYYWVRAHVYNFVHDDFWKTLAGKLTLIISVLIIVIGSLSLSLISETTSAHTAASQTEQVKNNKIQIACLENLLTDGQGLSKDVQTAQINESNAQSDWSKSLNRLLTDTPEQGKAEIAEFTRLSVVLQKASDALAVAEAAQQKYRTDHPFKLC